MPPISSSNAYSSLNLAALLAQVQSDSDLSNPYVKKGVDLLRQLVSTGYTGNAGTTHHTIQRATDLPAPDQKLAAALGYLELGTAQANGGAVPKNVDQQTAATIGLSLPALSQRSGAIKSNTTAMLQALAGGSTTTTTGTNMFNSGDYGASPVTPSTVSGSGFDSAPGAQGAEGDPIAPGSTLQGDPTAFMSSTEKEYYDKLNDPKTGDPEKAQLFALQCKMQKLNEMITFLTQMQTIRHDNAKAILQNFRA